MFLVWSFSRLCAIYWNQVLSRAWRCSWSSADRWCSKTWFIQHVWWLISKSPVLYGFSVNIHWLIQSQTHSRRTSSQRMHSDQLCFITTACFVGNSQTPKSIIHMSGSFWIYKRHTFTEQSVPFMIHKMKYWQCCLNINETYDKWIFIWLHILTHKWVVNTNRSNDNYGDSLFPKMYMNDVHLYIDRES